MKNFTIFILSLFVYTSVFSQDLIEKRHFENHPELGGDVLIKSSSVKVEKDEIFKTFEIESSEEGAYYMDAWIVAPFTKEGYPEYKVAINDVLSEFTFKPQRDGWQSLPLTNVKKSVVAVNLKKGKNNISIIGKKPEVPSIEFIKLSSNIRKTGISDTKYKEFVESLKSNTLKTASNANAAQTTASSLSGTAGEIYDYYLNLPYNFTQWWMLYFSQGENINITAGSSSFPCVIELLDKIDPDSRSWSARSTTGSSNLIVTIPVSGYYVLLIRSLNPCDMGEIPTTICFGNYCSTYNNTIVTYSPQYAVTPGYPTQANFFTCKTNGGDTWLFLSDNSGRIRAYNKDGGTKSDGYSWGGASRITTSLTNISYGLVFREYVYTSNYGVCDLYMGLASPTTSGSWDEYHYINFPNLPADNSFLSGGNLPYNCIDWSVGITDTSAIPFYYNMEDWDDFYEAYGYTRIGANANNAAIALWGHTDSTITHASVRKNSQNSYPHGFEWESKIGYARDRIMHTRDALVNNNTNIANAFGIIQHYYRPVSGTVNYSPSVTSQTRESSFSTSELNRIAALKNNIPVAILSDFETNYLAWKKTWDKPEIAIHSDPFMYARSSEYESLLEYCMKYGKAIWPLLFDNLVQKDIFVISLLRDLTYTEKGNFGAKITQSASVKIPSLYTMQVDYCKKLLAKEDGNMLKSILDISATEEKTFEVTVAVANSQEIQLSLYSEKNEKALVRIYNVFGGLELDANYNISKGNQTLIINTSNLKKGICIVKISIGGESISKSISI
jgi:hypothetical protein